MAIPQFVVNAATSLGEQARNQEQYKSAQRQPHEGLRQAYGTIIEVHKTKPLIRASSDKGCNSAGNKWIILNHGVQEIMERWGSVRTGFRVLITFSGGPDVGNANATIVGIEGEQTGNKDLLPNDAAMGFYRICSPGSGV